MKLTSGITKICGTIGESTGLIFALTKVCTHLMAAAADVRTLSEFAFFLIEQSMRLLLPLELEVLCLYTFP